MTITPKISVIVPIYNAEKYISKCVDSILVQTFSDYEIILIDDGSTDKSGKIIDAIAQKDSRIKVIHQFNKGVTKARYKGVLESRGEWIMFVDADDKLFEYSLKDLYEPVEKGDYDIIVGTRYTNCTNVLSRQEYIDKFILYNFPHTVCSRLYRRDLLDDFAFDIPPEIVKGEDYIINLRVCFKNKKEVYVVKKLVYNHNNFNASSCITTFRSTLDYEVQFSKYRDLSFPEGMLEKYIIKVINDRFSGIFTVINDNIFSIKRKDIINHKYFIDLMNDVERYSYQMNDHEKMLLSDSAFRKEKFKLCVWWLIKTPLKWIISEFY